MKAKIFLYPVTIKEFHLDTFGHVNNAVYLMILEEARWDLLNRNGYGMKKMQETQLGPTILEIKISFLREFCLHDKIVIQTQMISYENKIARLSQKMLRNDVVCCQAELTVGLFDMKTRKLISPTQEWLNAVGTAL